MILFALLNMAFTQEYELDHFNREINPKGKLECPKVELQTYSGTQIGYQKPIQVHAAFQKKLQRMEELIVESAMSIYGRKPHKIKHSGGYICKRIGGYPNLLSEHSLGNAIDISRFYFPALKEGESRPTDLPKALHTSFVVTIYEHWTDDKTHDGRHQQFLHSFARAMIAEELFRVLLGPAFPNHKDHFHLDMANYSLNAIF